VFSGADLSSANLPAAESPEEFGTDPNLSGTITMAEFVESRFIPEFVATKRAPGRDYFKSILKHVLPPEHVAQMFAAQRGTEKGKLASVPGWPYIHGLSLAEVNHDVIQGLTSAALEHGYSIQTATHVRNVIRSIFSHAMRTGCYCEPNPAASVVLPRLLPRADSSLTLAQLRAVLRAMVYPEREVVLLTVLTDMNLAEICGLPWKYVNLFGSSRMVENELIPPKMAAIRKQSYRCEISSVMRSRRRFVRIPRILASHLFDLKQRKQFTGPEDFVLVSRNGNPVHPANMAARRLKSISESLEIPGLAWSVFYKTRSKLRKELGEGLCEMFDDVLPLPKHVPSVPNELQFRSSL
jgi:site-specific recombinase XerD